MTQTADSAHEARERALARVGLEADLEDAVFKLLEAGAPHDQVRDVVSEAIAEWVDEHS